MNTFLHFLEHGKTQFQVVADAKQFLDEHGFTALTDYTSLSDLKPGKYYLCPFSSVLLPFVKGDCVRQVRIAAAHTDFPMLKLKPNPELKKQGYLQLNVEPYGGLIRESWFDRPLAIAGKVICRGNHIFNPEVRLFDSGRPVCILPNLAPHLNRGDKKQDMDVQKEMLPIIGIEDKQAPMEHDFLRNYLASELNLEASAILDYDLYLSICDTPTNIGIDGKLLSSPRIDNLSSVCAILESLARTEPSDTLQLAALFDNEEIGSRSKQGADNLLLAELVKEISGQSAAMLTQTGFLLSVDVAHATHPNYSEKSDITNFVVPGNGVVLKTSASQRYVNDSEASACILALCEQHAIALQKTVNRSGMPGGQTLGPILSSYLPMRACDIGIPILAMHAANEVMHKNDYTALTNLLFHFFTES